MMKSVFHWRNEMINDLYVIHKFINEQKEKLLQNYTECQNMPRDIIQKYSDMLECAEIGIGALVTREITDSDTFAGIPLKEAIKIVIDYKKR